MKKILLIAAVLGLAACNSNDPASLVTTYKYIVVHPDEAMFTCPILKTFPKWNTLTDAQVARVIGELYKNNITCKSSIESIRKFLDDADVGLNTK
jgi:type IV pilus biogenesis protein CpaD/CtpE